MDHQKSPILLIFGILSLGGCGGHPLRLKLNLKDNKKKNCPRTTCTIQLISDEDER